MGEVPLEGLAAIWAPVRTLASVAQGRRVLLAFGVVALYAALSLISSSIVVFGGLMQTQFEAGGAELPPEFEDFFVYIEVFSLIFAVVYPFVSWLLVSGLMHLVTRFFGGTGPFSGMLAAVGVAHVALVISSVVGILLTGLQIALESRNVAAESPATIAIGGLSSLLGLAALGWFVVLVVIGAAFARRVGYGESAGSCAISCASCVGLILVVVVVFAVLIGMLIGAVGSAGPS